MDGFAYLMKKACDVPMKIAQRVLSAAQGVLKAAQSVYNKAVAIVRKVMNKLKEIVKFLTDCQLIRVGFKATSLTNPTVTLKLSLKMSGKIQKYSLTLNLKKTAHDMKKMAAGTVKKIFAQAAAAAKKVITDLKNAIKLKEERLEEEMERMESAMDEDVRAEYVAMRDAALEEIRRERESARLGDSKTCRDVEGTDGHCWSEA